MAKIPIVSCKRLPAYTNFPSAETRISEQKFACVAGWKGGNGLPLFESSSAGIVVEQHDRRAFLLDRVEPLAVRMKMEVSWTIARGNATLGVAAGASLPLAASNFQM